MPGFSARPGPRSPKTWHICSFPLCTTATARPNVPEWGEPRDRPRPQSKTHFLRKEFIIQNLALIFQFLPAPSSSLHPMNGETKCARFLGSSGCSFPLCTTARARPNVPEWREPRDRLRPQAKTHFLRKEFITQNLALIFQFFARSLLLPTPNERRDQMCQVFGLARARRARKPGTFAPSLLAPQQRQGQMCRNRREPRDRPRPQSKTHFLRKEFITQNLALIFQFLPAPSSFLLLPTPNERRDQMCQVFRLARARGARKPGTFAPSLLAPQQRQGHMCRNGVEGTPRSAPTPIKNALFSKRIYHSKSGPDFSIFASSLLFPPPRYTQ